MAENIRLMQGNEAVVEGAMIGGLRFFGGYPITPSTEIAEHLARRLPKVGGKFIQMEDEIASMASIIGASLAGSKSMTATSGPGFSLMVEGIGYAYMAEVPTVIVNVQRGGPSTGLPTKVSQSDTMQARWGTHGDYIAIALAPQSVRETLDLTVRAMNLAEVYRTPVTLLTDEVLGHMREKVTIPEEGELEIINRLKPDVPASWYKHFEITPNFKSPMASFGDGYRFHVTGLTHDEEGFPTNKSVEILAKLTKLRNKIMRYLDDICQIETDGMEDAHVAVYAYGIVARAARQAVQMARARRMKVGQIRPITIWPTHEKKYKEIFSSKNLEVVIVAELNQGQLVYEVQRLVPKYVEVVSLNRFDSELITPAQILNKIKEVR
ncbi:MAG: 2-oxoacid:acceptor oxidoreductase subunit alpha [Candidatus Zixiibacteriota bacterium]|nr:MAG: 2-oxoacid:acceptor oxidoreductase subunit alpha [candidate division Zixibacteria bacterium]